MCGHGREGEAKVIRSATATPMLQLAPGGDTIEKYTCSPDRELLNILLCDRTSKKNILWATTEYIPLGPEFGEFCEITPELVTGKYKTLIQPRVKKSLAARLDRTREKAEVFTPSWICNKQNNLVDRAWFGQEDIFNREHGR